MWVVCVWGLMRDGRVCCVYVHAGRDGRRPCAPCSNESSEGGVSFKGVVIVIAELTTRSGRLEATRREIHPPTPEPTRMTGDLVMSRSMRKMVSAVQRLTVPAAKSPVDLGCRW